MKFSFDEICEFINGGAWSDTEYSESGIRVIKVTNMIDGTIVPMEDNYLPFSKYEIYKKHELMYNDIVVATVGSHPTQPGSVVGRTSRISKKVAGSFLNQNAVCIRTKCNDLVEQTYLFYLTKTILFKHHIESRARGSANQVRMALGELKKFIADYPPLPTQRKVATILTAYDDLIENNQRRIALLEKMAEQIYREWFVRMRFPGHETAKFEKGVPVGWEVARIENAFQFTGGATPSKEVDRYWKNGDINWFTPTDITSAKGIFLEQSGLQCTEEGLAQSSARLFPPYSIMMTSRATIGAIGINVTPACTNQGFITCIPNAEYPLAFLYHWLKSSKPYFELLSGGATFPELTKSTFKKIEILTPPKHIVSAFEELTAPLLQMLEIYLQKNKNLVKTRDLLLPRLISGKLSVDALDIQSPPVG